ncbi:MAG: serine hydrolase domain-containing protein [Anaerolineae bacterium]
MELCAPESVGLSSERLERLATFMNDLVAGNRVPGIMTLIQRRDKVVHLGKFGLMDIEAGRSMEEDGIFRIYSMTKPIVSVAAMMLFEEGRLSLTDPVSKFIPAFAKTKVCTGTNALGLTLTEQQPQMNIHHLLTHTSGLSYGSFFDTPVDELYRQAGQGPIRRDRPLQELMDILAGLPLVFQPGTCWRYSMSTDVLGYVVQVVADMPLADFLKERIFKPLGMVDTDFMVPAGQVSRLAQIYGSNALYDPQPIPPAMVMGIADVTTPTTGPSGGGGLVSTLADYLQFCRCLLKQGIYDGGRLLSRKTMELMTANHIPDSMMPIYMGLEQRDHGFGLGFRVTTHLGQARKLSSVGEFGWGGAANTFFLIDPAEELILLMMTQYLPTAPYTVNEIFRNLAYQAIID